MSTTAKKANGASQAVARILTVARILMAGEAGHGIRFCGVLLAQAAASEGRQVAEAALFGAAVRKGEVTSHVVISSSAIHYPFVEEPDYLLVTSQAAYDRYASRQRPLTLILYDASAISPVALPCVEQVGVPAASVLTRRYGRVQGATVALLGALSSATRVVAFDSLERQVSLLPTKQREVNRFMLEQGHLLCRDPVQSPVTVSPAPVVAVDPGKCAMSRANPSGDGPSARTSDKTAVQTCRICELICPDLAITHDPLTEIARVDPVHCKRCGLCVHFCPKEAMRMVLI